ncbi:hypothetical protein O3P69_008807 [Scylla paramamosain]|uniref:Secreted protein n=1 Tax=Scylla paramamosain TaxID=85552 RepID=A0AAW0TNL6_SCYPA
MLFGGLVWLRCRVDRRVWSVVELVDVGLASQSSTDGLSSFHLSSPWCVGCGGVVGQVWRGCGGRVEPSVGRVEQLPIALRGTATLSPSPPLPRDGHIEQTGTHLPLLPPFSPTF